MWQGRASAACKSKGPTARFPVKAWPISQWARGSRSPGYGRKQWRLGGRQSPTWQDPGVTAGRGPEWPESDHGARPGARRCLHALRQRLPVGEVRHRGRAGRVAEKPVATPTPQALLQTRSASPLSSTPQPVAASSSGSFLCATPLVPPPDDLPSVSHYRDPRLFAQDFFSSSLCFCALFSPRYFLHFETHGSCILTPFTCIVLGDFHQLRVDRSLPPPHLYLCALMLALGNLKEPYNKTFLPRSGCCSRFTFTTVLFPFLRDSGNLCPSLSCHHNI